MNPEKARGCSGVSMPGPIIGVSTGPQCETWTGAQRDAREKMTRFPTASRAPGEGAVETAGSVAIRERKAQRDRRATEARSKTQQRNELTSPRSPLQVRAARPTTPERRRADATTAARARQRRIRGLKRGAVVGVPGSFLRVPRRRSELPPVRRRRCPWSPRAPAASRLGNCRHAHRWGQLAADGAGRAGGNRQLDPGAQPGDPLVLCLAI